MKELGTRVSSSISLALVAVDSVTQPSAILGLLSSEVCDPCRVSQEMRLITLLNNNMGLPIIAEPLICSFATIVSHLGTKQAPANINPQNLITTRVLTNALEFPPPSLVLAARKMLLTHIKNDECVSFTLYQL